MHPCHTHTPSELAALVAETLTFSGWLDIDGFLIPVLLSSDRSAGERQQRVLTLNGRRSA
jgi:hypothetical protein